MLQLLPQSQVVVPNGATAKEIIDNLEDYITNYSCETISIDISFVNVIDSSYITTMVSTMHYIKYPNGKISWVVSSDIVEDFVKDMNLGNSDYIL